MQSPDRQGVRVDVNQPVPCQFPVQGWVYLQVLDDVHCCAELIGVGLCLVAAILVVAHETGPHSRGQAYHKGKTCSLTEPLHMRCSITISCCWCEPAAEF